MVPHAVDEEGGRPGHAAEVGRVHVLGDLGGPGMRPEVGQEPFGVQAELLGVTDEILRGERALVVE